MSGNTNFTRLENWDFNVFSDRFQGEVYGDDRYEDGTKVITSPVGQEVPFDWIVEGAVVRTTNTPYLLGKPNEIGVFVNEEDW